MKEAKPYLDRVGLCETHDREKFQELPFVPSEAGLTEAQVLWHMEDMQAEKKRPAAGLN